MKHEIDLEKELEKLFQQWESLHVNGGSDPFHSDGVNLNLVRNHIVHYKSEMKQRKLFSEIYYKETPPEVAYDYMAKPDDIRAAASKSLRVYLVNEDYAFILANMSKLSKKQLEENHIDNALRYVTGLKQFILEDNLVAMRRHQSPLSYLESFHECRKKMETILTTAYSQSFHFESEDTMPGQYNFNDWENEV